MHQFPAPRRALCSAVVLTALAAFGALGTVACLGPEHSVVWICLNPATGKEDGSIGDDSHYVNGVFDPCHCYDPCGPEKSCPIVVDAGPPGPGCPVHDADDGGP